MFRKNHSTGSAVTRLAANPCLWARQTQRWSDFDYEGPARDGFSVDWPIRYKDIAPWYSYVEKFAGISGNKDGLDVLPDGEFLPPLELSCVENYFKDFVSKNYKDRHVIYARCAHLTEPKQIHLDQGRGQCQNRNLCQRGCPFGGYFAANSTTIPWALKTGNMTLRPFSVVHSIIYDEKKGKATGVRVVDAHSKEVIEYYARIIFVNAAAVNTNLILSKFKIKPLPQRPWVMTAASWENILHFIITGRIFRRNTKDYMDSTTAGGRPTSAYIPRFRNVHKQETDFLRGYASGFFAGQVSAFQKQKDSETTLKDNLAKKDPGPWRVGSQMMGETIPKETNFLSLDPVKKDEWGSSATSVFSRL